jgi:hypothetical protein
MFVLCAACLLGGVDIILTATGTCLVFCCVSSGRCGYHIDCNMDIFGPRVVCLLEVRDHAAG